MKKQALKTIFALLLLCILMPVKTTGQVPMNPHARTFEIKIQTELLGDKDWAKRMKKVKKIYGLQSVEPVMLPTGKPGMRGYPKPDKYRGRYSGYSLFDSAGNNITDYHRVHAVEIHSIRGKDYIWYLTDKVNNEGLLCNMDGKRLFSKPSTYQIVSDLNHVLLWCKQKDVSIFYDTDGNMVHYGGEFIYAVNFVRAITPGIKSISADGKTIDMLCAQTPEYFYTSGIVNGSSYKYRDIKDFKGNKIFNTGVWNAVPFPSIESGYFLNLPENTEFEVKDAVQEVGGDILPYRTLGIKYRNTSARLYDYSEQIIPDSYGLEYSAPDHSIKYTVLDNHRYLKGAKFLADSTLDVPPLFADVMYKYDEKANQWKPYVRRTLFGLSEPYVTGMDTTPNYRNNVERAIENNEMSIYNIHKAYGENHKWDEKDLAYVDYFCTKEARSRLEGYFISYESAKLLKYTTEKLAKEGKEVIKDIESNYHLYAFNIAKGIYEQAQKDYANKATAELAKNLIAMTDQKIEAAQQRAAQLVSIYNLEIEQNEKNIQRKGRNEAIRAQQEEVARAAAAARQQAQETDRTTNALIIGAVMRSVGNALGRALGGRSGGSNLRVNYVGGGGGYNAPVNGGTAGTSSGAAVQTAKKCGRCNGTGSCNACLGHPGKATAGSKSPNCSACHGSGRCTYCGGSGYRN